MLQYYQLIQIQYFLLILYQIPEINIVFNDKIKTVASIEIAAINGAVPILKANQKTTTI